jgi:hypothetical protein
MNFNWVFKNICEILGKNVEAYELFIHLVSIIVFITGPIFSYVVFQKKFCGFSLS